MERKEALEVVRKNMPTDRSLPVYEALQTLIPELAESEDERIRKRLITLIRVLDSLFFTGNNPSKEQCIAYLEKQKEQKPTEIAPNQFDGITYGMQGHSTEKPTEEAKDFFDSAKFYGDRELPQLAKVKATGKIINIINGILSTEEKKWIAYSSDKEDGYKIYRPNELFFLDTERKSEDRFEEAREKYQVAWSEKDEAAYDAFMCEVVNEKMNPTIEQIKWLRCIRDRLKSLRPVSKESLQSHWKPSEEQIHAIIEALKYLPNNKDEWMILNTLVDVFKKLM